MNYLKDSFTVPGPAENFNDMVYSRGCICSACRHREEMDRLAELEASKTMED